MSRDAPSSRRAPDEKDANSAQSRPVTRHPTELVRERRHILGLTQEQAAQRAGISRNEWNQMETGHRGIGPVNAARLAAVLGGETEEYRTRASHSEIAELKKRVGELERRVARLEDQ